MSTASASRVPAVVVGAGPAGLATSWHLARLGVEHVVLERDSVGATWRSARWDSFTLVTPAWSVRLPGLRMPDGAPDAFLPRDTFVELLDRYARDTGLPVRTGVEVHGLRRALDGDGYVLDTSEGDRRTRAVVIASGALRLPKVPAGVDVPPGVTALHAVDYRRPEQLPPGAVLVVGSGQTGTQIADELRRAGRRVLLSTSAVGRVPRRYRDRDVFTWLRQLGMLDQTTEHAPPEARRAPQPALSGAHGGRTLALQQLARDGVVLLGRLTGIHGGRLHFADDLADHMRGADAFAERFRNQVDQYLQGHPPRTGPAGTEPAQPAPADTDPAELPLDAVPSAPTEIDASGEGISTVLWCTGMLPDTAWLPDEVLTPTGVPQHHRGMTSLPGVHVVGFPWMTHRASGILYGMGTDAAHAAERIRADLTS
ncbi:NAD(P)/FAD-dependent oxidoreductase [Streptomyces sp. SID3212]|uniref:flavin-containing monooxygenase n=1 Tax=Streptomyces sp. SID3212 TaxID=2690259 RepID=UPI00136B4334|nr:NAD(P)/FAD-dependent oxidoreductase [Streptomyces sp. SID3212]MYV57089.1 NAD(P)-binding domain-containing protein [Streptomyces sp. SID3212]